MVEEFLAETREFFLVFLTDYSDDTDLLKCENF